MIVNEKLFTKDPVIIMDPSITEDKVIQIEGEEKFHDTSKFQRIPSIVRTNSGRLIAVFDVRYGLYSDLGNRSQNDIDIGMSYSDDMGDTWSTPKIIIHYSDSDGMGSGDPSIVYDYNKNIIYVTALGCHGLSDMSQSKTFLVTSSDDGETWSSPVDIFDQVAIDLKVTYLDIEFPYNHIFGGVGNGIITKHQSNEENNGLVIFPAQYWASVLNSSGKPDRLSATTFSGLFIGRYNSDGDISWSPSITPSLYDDNPGSNTSECQVTELPNGDLLLRCKVERLNASDLNIPNENSNQVQFRFFRSTDCGQSWTMVDIEYNTAFTRSLKVQGSIHYSELDGYLYITYAYPDGGSAAADSRRGQMILKRTKDFDNLLDWEFVDTIFSGQYTGGYTGILPLTKDIVGVIAEAPDTEAFEASNPTLSVTSKSIQFIKYDFRVASIKSELGVNDLRKLNKSFIKDISNHEVSVTNAFNPPLSLSKTWENALVTSGFDLLVSELIEGNESIITNKKLVKLGVQTSAKRQSSVSQYTDNIYLAIYDGEDLVAISSNCVTSTWLFYNNGSVFEFEFNADIDIDTTYVVIPVTISGSTLTSAKFPYRLFCRDSEDTSTLKIINQIGSAYYSPIVYINLATETNSPIVFLPNRSGQLVTTTDIQSLIAKVTQLEEFANKLVEVLSSEGINISYPVTVSTPRINKPSLVTSSSPNENELEYDSTEIEEEIHDFN